MSAPIGRFEMIDDAMAEILRNKTEVEHLRKAMGMCKSARVLLRGAIETEHSDWTDTQVNHEIANRISHGAVTDEMFNHAKLSVLEDWSLVQQRVDDVTS